MGFVVSTLEKVFYHLPFTWHSGWHRASRKHVSVSMKGE